MFVIILLVSFSSALAMDKQDMVNSGESAWASYVCSSLAVIGTNDAEAVRLGKYAYEQGKIFYESLNEGKIGKDDTEKGVPIGVLFAAGGPSIDFMLGRLSESVMNKTFKDIEDEYMSKYGKHDLRYYYILADKKFSEKNCDLIGK